jgi:hypothetical protein
MRFGILRYAAVSGGSMNNRNGVHNDKPYLQQLRFVKGISKTTRLLVFPLHVQPKRILLDLVTFCEQVPTMESTAIMSLLSSYLSVRCDYKPT